MAFDFGAAGGGAAAGLEDVLKRMFLEGEARRRMAMAQQQMSVQERGQDITARGQDMLQSRWSTDRGDALAAAEAEASKAAAADAEKQQVFGRLRAVSPTMARLVDARQAGFNINDPHQIETDEEHAPHQQATRTADLGDFEQKEKIKAKYNPPTPREERLVQIEGPNGVPVWVRESQAVGKPAAQAARAVTGQERGVLAFYNRAKDASDTIVTPDQSGKSLEDRVAGAGLMGQAQLQYAPNIMQTADQQAYRQAQRAFTEARLRKESGAAIPTAEYDNDAKTYFAQPGDTPETIQQKRQKRETVLEGLKFSSGRAYDEFYGEPNRTSGGGRARGGGGPQVGERRMINGQMGEWDGKGWKPVQ